MPCTRTITAGSFVAACSSVFNSSGTTMTVSDSSGSYTQIDAKSHSGASDDQIFCHGKANHPGGAMTVTFNPQGSTANIGGFIFEISGAATSSAVDTVPTAT